MRRRTELALLGSTFGLVSLITSLVAYDCLITNWQVSLGPKTPVLPNPKASHEASAPPNYSKYRNLLTRSLGACQIE
ncbi:hypothetical protein M433DRAFT_154750 [Acidomyces richmondensis BFW]|nr:MAG: hypothetical protein FE78DRAFT_91024 [Acidomyces sp. 'richmondensis']KYG45222.1 hypothetical protein M433DRAFT_154750 [Acidomyces richmondensis BFW]